MTFSASLSYRGRTNHVFFFRDFSDNSVNQQEALQLPSSSKHELLSSLSERVTCRDQKENNDGRSEGLEGKLTDAHTHTLNVSISMCRQIV